jgi:hypothetical protein
MRRLKRAVTSRIVRKQELLAAMEAYTEQFIQTLIEEYGVSD